MDKIKLLIIDDHPMMREALAAALITEADMEIVGEASNGLTGMELSQKLNPDVILMDLLMSAMDGLEAIVKILEVQPQMRILVVTSLETEDKILAAMQAGALGYFPKTAPRPYLIEAIRKVADGVPYLPAGIAQKLLKSLREMKPVEPSQPAADEPLTTRQNEILAFLAEGMTDQEIGARLHLGETTVRTHIHHISQRLGLETRTQVVAYAANRLYRDRGRNSG
jgi:two-component system, NarL family, response regulator LiaR